MERSSASQDASDFFVEWQMLDEPGPFIDLADDRPEAEVILAEERVKTSSGR